MFKIGIIQKIHDDGLELLDTNKNFEYEIIDDISEENLLKKIHLYDGVTLRVSKLSNDLLSKAMSSITRLLHLKTNTQMQKKTNLLLCSRVTKK